MSPARLGTVLVVDDVTENIAVLAGILQGQYRVIFSTNGPEALRLVQQESVDLILLDVMMPEMDGYQVCQRLKEHLPTAHIPVVFISALGEVADEARGLELGAVDYLQKPCHASIVRLRVRLHIEQHNQSLALERRVRERTMELEDSRREIVRRLGRAAEYRDNETGMHVLRVGKVAQLLGQAAGLSEAQASLLQQAAPMHDIGKIGIPDHVLLKPGSLTPDEWSLMQTHATIGAEIIGDHDNELLRLARSIALTHHEKWDGSGYPRGLAGEAIPIEGRITAIADVFDALTSVRPYKNAWPLELALDFMRSQSGRGFDPALLALFFEQFDAVQRIRAQYVDPHEPSDL